VNDERTCDALVPELQPAIRLLQELAQAGVELTVEGTHLRFKAPPGVVDPERRKMLHEWKWQLIALLRARLDDALTLPQPTPETEAVWEPYGHQATMVEDPDVRNVLCPVRWQRAFDGSTARTAFDALLARHSILRTRYARGQDGRLLAVTEKRMSVPLSVTDLRHLPPQLLESALARTSTSFARRPFDLYRGPLVAFHAVRLTDGITFYVVCAHHSLCDAVSGELVSDELRALLAAAHSGSPASLPSVPMEYRDFARERSRWLESEEAGHHVEFWRAVLSRCGSVCRLPYDRRDPPEPDFLRPGVVGSLPEGTVERLRTLAAAAKTTMSVLFSALLAVVFSRWTGSTEVTTWICHVGRSRPEHYRIVGCFMNHWLLRVDLSDDPDFLEVLRRVHAYYFEAAPHLEVTLHRLLPEMSRSEVRSAYPAVIVNFMPFARHSRTIPSSSRPARQPPVSSGYSKSSPLAMDISCLESSHELAWSVEYSSHLFEDSTVERFSLSLAVVAESVSQDPTVRMSLLPLRQIAAHAHSHPSA
jgi:hypothetical protein